MTILAKPFSEKKGDKLVVPLVDNEHLPPPSAPEDIESGDSEHRPPILILTADRLSAATTLCLLLTALSVVGVGIIGGKLLYNEYFSVESQSRNYQMSRNFHEKAGSFLGYAQVPLGDNNDIDETETDRLFSGNENWRINDDPEIKQMLGFLPENFEINDDKKYEKIDVPDFRDGRSGRFIHDFNTNMTGIIDVTGHRCFVMPLNRENVLPPKSLFDLIHKMWEGYYKVDTDVVRKSMRVVLPRLEDTESIGSYIANECADLPIYRLEKVERGIVKRSASLHSEAKFAQFAGKGITEFDIVNLDEVLAYENKMNSH